MIRIDGDDPGILVVDPRKVARDFLGVGLADVNTDEGRRDVGLLVEVSEAEAREHRVVVYDGGLVLGAEAGAEVVLGLGAVAVDAIDKGRDGFGCCFGGGRSSWVVGIGWGKPVSGAWRIHHCLG